MSFPFIPRTIAKRNANVRTAKVNNPLGSVSTTSRPNASSKGKEKAPEGPSAEECAILVSLALSDYVLWKDSDLRMKLDENDGYASLHGLLFHCQVLAPLRKVPQTLLVKHLKTHLAEVLEFRMMVAEPKPWFSRAGEASSQQGGPLGGYEVRLKAPNTSVLSKPDWEKRMVYVENVPVQYRNISALVRFLVGLLPVQESTLFSRVQNVYLPPHHRDNPGDPPTFKGFAVVTFLHESDAQYVKESWPWQGDFSEDKAGNRASGSLEDDITCEARKFGFRTTSKSTWEALRADYLAYRQQLIEEINASQDSSAPAAPSVPPPPLRSAPSESGLPEPASKTRLHQVRCEEPADTPQITLSSPYPFGCLVFIKNVHPDTNKTTLKTLFGKSLAHANGIDYVDFNKGMDTCYLRLSTASSAQLLLTTSGTMVQTSGLDDAGSSPSLKDKDVKPISVEVVLGKREEMYWQKVPEKIRRGAVEKAVKLHYGDAVEDEGEAQGDGNDKKSRKRRKR